MKKRCYNTNSRGYKWYGAKGVYVCDEWKHSAKTFIEWALANGWKKGFQIDKDILSLQLGVLPFYSPDTCMFISKTANVGERNTRTSSKLTSQCRVNIHRKYVKGNGRYLAKQYGVSTALISIIVNTDLQELLDALK